MKLLTIGFEFNGGYHYALIHPKDKDGVSQYQVTVMNGKLEQLLYGNHFIREENGVIIMDQCKEKNPQNELRRTIAVALSQHLQKEIISSSMPIM